MKAKLSKTVTDIYRLELDRSLIASDDVDLQRKYNIRKLSTKNCNEIFGIIDVEKLASENCTAWENSAVAQGGFKIGFNKAMELNKMFTLDNMRKVIEMSRDIKYVTFSIDELIQSLQQPNEIDVEIEMEEAQEIYRDGTVKIIRVPKLDSEGCLILKRAT